MSGLEEFQSILRAARGSMSLRQFASKTGLTFSTLRRLESGETISPDQSTLDALASALPHSADELRAIIEGRRAEPQRAIITAEDVLKEVDSFSKDEIKRLIYLIVDKYL
ncbi:hypothetical protein N836_35770 [Leptolyngbya sp. Heron Island J]|uniref:helix-turn-helix domain-containing protein n=1 Tax=Leptolyngbya sp. Heron Island J TaxID=1385935 RepID=UPI0003B996F7|nr:helix-turn-helix transcriptional regulator [Leptolyngbya sp. Heron Island J]ESA37733.1 hypothetical protein N836_35770 [Leptolyngbya sp. Heron Island J]